MNVRGLSGKYYKLDSSPFGGGGEGDIYEITHNGNLLKRNKYYLVTVGI